MSALKLYLEQVQAERGLRRLERIRALRWYIRTTADKDLTTAINKITDMTELKILWECGLTLTIQNEVLRRTRELTERKI